MKIEEGTNLLFDRHTLSGSPFPSLEQPIKVTHTRNPRLIETTKNQLCGKIMTKIIFEILLIPITVVILPDGILFSCINLEAGKFYNIAQGFFHFFRLGQRRFYINIVYKQRAMKTA